MARTHEDFVDIVKIKNPSVEIVGIYTKAQDRIAVRCKECGYENSKWLGKCPECNKWNSFVEEIEDRSAKAKKEVFVIEKSGSRPLSINSIETIKEQRFSPCINELDRVVGGGVVKGSLVLVGGDPGIGKSTILIQVSSNVANSGKKVLYISGEESASQIKMRAQR